MFGFWNGGQYHGGALFGGPGDEQIAGVRLEAQGDFDDVFGGLAESEDHLRYAVAQGSVMVDIGEPDILKRHMAQPPHCRIHVRFARAYPLEQFPQLCLIHAKTRFCRLVVVCYFALRPRLTRGHRGIVSSHQTSGIRRICRWGTAGCAGRFPRLACSDRAK